MNKYRTRYFIVKNYWANHRLHGWGNGYVIIDKNHPLYEKKWYEIEKINVHGGITFTKIIDDELIKRWNFLDFSSEKGNWIIGFDTSHENDDEFLDKEYVKKETILLKNQLENYMYTIYYCDYCDEEFTSEYECENHEEDCEHNPYRDDEEIMINDKCLSCKNYRVNSHKTAFTCIEENSPFELIYLTDDMQECEYFDEKIGSTNIEILI